MEGLSVRHLFIISVILRNRSQLSYDVSPFPRNGKRELYAATVTSTLRTFLFPRKLHLQ